MSTVRGAMLEALASAQEMEQVLVDACGNPSSAEAGRWPASAHLDHLAWWREHAAEVLDAVRSGTPTPQVAGTIDDQNARLQERYRDHPAAVSRQHADNSYRQLREAIEASSEDGLLAPDPRYPERALWENVPGSLEEHLGGHVIQWHLEEGDLTAAEAAARRVYDLQMGYPDPRRHALGTYNLGCYFALRGRSEDALALVRQAFRMDPGIREFAKDDTDMDSIREHLDQPDEAGREANPLLPGSGVSSQ